MKIKYFFLLVLLIILIGCNNKTSNGPKILYSGYSIRVEGGRKNMNLDSITPLLKLIPQLNTKNELYETGKGYWIGYNDLMFSIAVHADRAINPLMCFFDTTTSYKSKIAALYTLHLIGINCKIIGRYNEDFINLKARDALFKLLAQNEKMQDQIILLLIRDPRESDIPKLFNIMDSSKMDCWAICSGLLRYDLKDIPVAQQLPEYLLLKKITLSKQIDFPDNETIQEILKRFSEKYNDFVNVEDTLYNYNFRMPIRIGFDDNEISLAYMKRFCTITDYCSIGPNFQYFYRKGKMHFCSAATTKNLWLNWWKSQSESYKDSLKNSQQKMATKRFY
jgi:hypothetical protein